MLMWSTVTNPSKPAANVVKRLRLSCTDLTDCQPELSGNLDARGRTPESDPGTKACSEHPSKILGEPVEQVAVTY